jgi:hypothetical protein
MKMPSATARRWLYRVGNAALLVAVGYAVINGDQAALWGLLLNALLGMADANVPATIETLED